MFCFSISIGQVKLKSSERQITDTGFVFFIYKEEPEFVSINISTKLPTFKQFVSKNLNTAYQLSWQQLALDTCSKYVKQFKVFNYLKDTNIYLKIIPVVLTYTILSYSKTIEQMKVATILEKFVFKDKFVTIQSVGGIPIRVEKFKILE